MSHAVKAPNGGWGWVVVGGAFISHFLTCGFEKGYSVLYVEIIEQFNTTAALAAGLSGLSAAIRLLFAPLAVVLVNHFSEQKVVIFGGVLCFIGLLVSSLSERFVGVVIGYGILFGFGLTLVYTPSLTICTSYFSTRRSTAVGTSLSGCGFAALAMPYLIVCLLDTYTYSGAMMILAAISLHYSVAGALYRQLPPTNTSTAASVQETGGNKSITKRFREWISPNRCSRFYMKSSTNPWLLLFLFSFCFNMMGSGPVTTLVIHHAENLGYERHISVQLLAVEGVTQIFIRIFTGLVFDHPRIKPYRGVVWSAMIAVSALIILLLAYARSLWLLSILMCLRGFALAIYIAQQAVIAADMCEHTPERLKHTIGLTQIGKGVGVLLGSWCAGAIRDMTSDYRPAFIFLSSMQFIGSLAAGAAVLKAMRYQRRQQQHDQGVNGQTTVSDEYSVSCESVNLEDVSETTDELNQKDVLWDKKQYERVQQGQQSRELDHNEVQLHVQLRSGQGSESGRSPGPRTVVV